MEYIVVLSAGPVPVERQDLVWALSALAILLCLVLVFWLWQRFYKVYLLSKKFRHPADSRGLKDLDNLHQQGLISDEELKIIRKKRARRLTESLAPKTETGKDEQKDSDGTSQ